MASEPLVSVIIPTYNRAPLIGAAIQSVLDQTYKNIEIIVVDDGSTDDTQRALEPFAGRLNSLVTTNGGPSHARNIGMKAASGKYIAFLDSDDLYLPQKLELQVAFMEAHPDIGLVSTEYSSMRQGKIDEVRHMRSSHYVFDTFGWKYEDIYANKDTFELNGAIVPCYSGNIFKYMLRGPVLVSNTALFHRTILEHVGYQNEAYFNAEEFDFMTRISKRYLVAFLDTPTYVYRYGDDQISMVGSPASTTKLRTHATFFETSIKIAREWGCGDSAYYAENRAWLDRTLAEHNFRLGQIWLECGDARKAREYFSAGSHCDPALKSNSRIYLLSFLPRFARHGATMAWGLIRRATRETSKPIAP